MSSKAACPFCRHKQRLPDEAAGTTLRCPKCGLDYTAPAPETMAPPAASAPAPIPAAAVAAVAPSPPSRRASGPGAAPPSEAPRSLPRRRLTIPRWINVWGLTGLCLGSAALLAASLDVARWLTIPLAGVGLFAAVVGPAAATRCRGKDLAWCFVGGAVCLGVLTTALLSPRLLNARWGLDDKIEYDQFTGKLALASRDAKITANPLKDADWVDAAKHAVRQGDVHVMIESVVVDYAPLKSSGANHAKSASLLVTLQLRNVGRLQQVKYEGQALDTHRPTLTDQHGKSYDVKKFAAGAVVTGQVDREVLPPGRSLHDVMVFEAPAAPVDLDLRMPTEAWGGVGVCRFRIAGKTINFKVK